MRRSMCTKLLAFLLVLAAGCTHDPLTQIVVVVDSELDVPDEVDEIDVVVDGPDSDSESRRARLSGTGAVALPFAVATVWRSGGLGNLHVSARGLHGGDERIRVDVVTRFVEKQTRLLHLVLRRACVGVDCDDDEACLDATGTCVANDVETTPWHGEPPPVGTVHADAGEGMDAGPELPDAGADAGPMSVDAYVAPNDAWVGPPRDGAVAELVFNEVSADRADWVELYNRGTESIDLSGALIADTNGGAPRVANALRVAEGVVVAPEQYLFVLADVATTSGSLQSSCLDSGGPPLCLRAGWGIDRSMGERVVVLARDGVTVLASVDYPAALPAGVVWARRPNGSGAFQSSTTPTPGSANPD